ncbi:phage distal tail protein [Clostridium massiliamazoniense]|uniref:phage distal tail protein n=1 Tax=Clostridium massiliamazoniense TaxID=1347366 RepID=UPI0006D763E7|nr:phage tail domain-containing protein [Clostridium massiliamazoniense]
MEVLLKNLNTNEFIEFDNINYILNQIVTDNCDTQHSTSKTIKQIGEYITSTNVNSRSISIIGYIFANSDLDMASKREKLLNITSPFSEVQLVVNNKYQIKGKCDGLVKWAIGYDNNNSMFVKFMINILCPGTLWHNLNPTVVTSNSYIDEFKFKLSIPEEQGMIFAERVNNTISSIYNQCNVEVPMIITLTALKEISGIKITNLTTGQFFSIDIKMKAEDTLVINSEFGNKSVLLNGENVIGTVDILNSTWLMLNPGLNEFTYECNEGNKYGFDAQIEYYESYWGIVL